MTRPAMGRFALLLPALALVVALAGGCASRTPTPVKVVVTPITVTRDVVDAPLVTVTNAFETWSWMTRPDPVPRVTGGWTFRRGFDAGVGMDFSHYVFKALSGVFGVVTYIPCRSIWPNFPAGVSPWRRPGESWWGMYFPNTRALWRDEERDENRAPPPPQEGGPPR